MYLFQSIDKSCEIKNFLCRTVKIMTKSKIMFSIHFPITPVALFLLFISFFFMSNIFQKGYAFRKILRETRHRGAKAQC